MAKSSRGTANTAGRPRATKLVAHLGTPASKAAKKPNTLVNGRSAGTGHKG